MPHGSYSNLMEKQMPKTLTKMQEQIVAKVLTISATQHVFTRQGEVNSVNKLRERGLLTADCWGSVQHRHLTDRIKTVFFVENDHTFMIENFHGEGWLIFDDRQYITKVYNQGNAKRVVTAMKLLREHEKQQCQKDSTSSPMDRRSVVNAALTGPQAMSAVWSLTGGKRTLR
jgi:hypothetical protein